MRGIRCLVASVVLPSALACTMIAVGRNATADGSVIVAHSDDGGGGTGDLRLLRVPAQDHAEGSLRPVYEQFSGFPRLVSSDRGPAYQATPGQQDFKPAGTIPQVQHTYAYWDQDYGLMNEHQLSIAESTCGAKTAGFALGTGGSCLFAIDELSKVALERCQDARCAVRTMGDLAVSHGFYGNDAGTAKAPDYTGASEALAIADNTGEVWVFHVMTGAGGKSAIWAAQRVPDEHVVVVPNGFTIRTLNLDDNDNYMASPGVDELARHMGWYDPQRDGEFDFTKAYAVASGGNPHFPLYVGRRIWRVYDLLAPSLKLDPTLGWEASTPTYPWSIKPDAPVTVQRMMSIYRDHYEGSRFDLTKGIAAGPFGNPVRFNVDVPDEPFRGGFDRAISMFRTTFSFIAHVRGTMPDEVGGVFWYGQDAPHGTVYVPVYGSQAELPAAYAQGKQSEFSDDCAWWAFNFLNNWMGLRFDAMHADVRVQQQALEVAGFQMQEEVEAKAAALLADGHQQEAVDQLSAAACAHADHVVKTWWKLAYSMIARYSDGWRTTGEQPEQQEALGYPTWWLEAVGFTAFPGDSFTYPPPKITPIDYATIYYPNQHQDSELLASTAPLSDSGPSSSLVLLVAGSAIGALAVWLWGPRRKPQYDLVRDM